MSEFNVERYRAEIDKLREHLRVMDTELHNMKYECTPSGVSPMASTHLDQFGKAKGDMGIQLIEVIKAMLPGMKE